MVPLALNDFARMEGGVEPQSKKGVRMLLGRIHCASTAYR